MTNYDRQDSGYGLAEFITLLIFVALLVIPILKGGII